MEPSQLDDASIEAKTNILDTSHCMIKACRDSRSLCMDMNQVAVLKQFKHVPLDKFDASVSSPITTVSPQNKFPDRIFQTLTADVELVKIAEACFNA